MDIDENEIVKLAIQRYPIEKSLIGGCSGLKESDKNTYERKIWIEGFKAALELVKNNKE